MKGLIAWDSRTEVAWEPMYTLKSKGTSDPAYMQPRRMSVTVTATFMDTKDAVEWQEFLGEMLREMAA